MNDFSTLIKQHRLSKNLSLREAANIIGISHGYLDKLEKSFDSRTGAKNHPTPETLQMISNAYKIDYNQLLHLCGYIDAPYDNIPDKVKRLVSICSFLPSEDIAHLEKYASFLLQSTTSSQK